MTKGDIAELSIETIATGGAGLARVKGRPVFTPFTAPGDLARVRITEEHKTWFQAEPVEILEPSPQRVNPRCPLYGTCGGCSLQHLSYEAQLRAKEAILRESFIRIGGFESREDSRLPEIRLRPSAPWEYRNRVQFHWARGRKNRPGFMERKGAAVIPLEDCPIADPGIREALKNPGQKKLTPPPDKDRFTVFSRYGVFLSEGGNSKGTISLRGKEIRLDAGVFFQSNVAMLELLLEDLEALADTANPDLPLGDLYCGVGTFTAFLGNRFSGVQLVEENRAALILATLNTLGKNPTLYSFSAEAWVKSCVSGKESWGLLITDPPREGMSKTLRRYLAGSKAKILACVSCDPATLARDSKDLVAAGFRLRDLILYDFYPQTSHIESLAVFYRE